MTGTDDERETDLPLIDMVRPRWGDPGVSAHLPDAATALLGVTDAAPPEFDVDILAFPDRGLSVTARSAIEELVGVDHVDDSPSARAQHTRGYSMPDLLRMRAGDVADAPDLVVAPADHVEVATLLRICTTYRVAVVPFTGGTSVVGGLAPDLTDDAAPFAGVISLDLRRLDGVVAIDEISRTATFGAGTRGVTAEAILADRGYTLGHFPQSYAGAGLGGYAATRSAGQSSAGYGRFDEMVEGLVLATPAGTIEVGAAPRSAAGPDLRQLILGSEGVFGVITSVTVRIRPRPQRRVFEGFRFPDFATGSTALRLLAQDGPMPTVLRLSDEIETSINLSGGGSGSNDAGSDQLEESVEISGGCLAVVGYEGTAADVDRRRSAVTEILESCSGIAVGDGPGEAWRAGRFGAPYLRDPLLDAGILVETLETVTFWSGIAGLKAAVADALTTSLAASGTPPLIMCHISHVYASGASLYFTVVCPQADDPLAQWGAAKAAANDAIRAQGASITHHHAVGRDHRDAYHAEIGPVALEALRSVKKTLDPGGVCNPGILL